MPLSSCLNLFFPPLCLHCREEIPSQKYPLCFPCLEQLVLLEDTGRCLACFSCVGETQKRCVDCRVRGFRVGAACEYFGPAKTLVHQYKHGGAIHLAQAMASLMVLQFFRLGWPLPDLIVPVPQTWMRRLVRGYNQTALLAEEIASLLERPAVSLLKRRVGDFAQSGLNKEQREQLKQQSFDWKQERNLGGQVILLVDDVATTRSTLSHCAQVLREGSPKSIYALTFCAA